jgi:hypothetical protein
MGFNMSAETKARLAQSQAHANPAEELHTLKRHCLAIARTLCDENSSDLVESAVHSKDYTHRIGAAWYYGTAQKHDDCLFKLLEDENPLVSLAARESCVKIARDKYHAKHVDFGPLPNADIKTKTDAVVLWQTYFANKDKAPQNSSEPNPFKQTHKKSVYEILGIPKEPETNSDK